MKSRGLESNLYMHVCRVVPFAYAELWKGTGIFFFILGRAWLRAMHQSSALHWDTFACGASSLKLVCGPCSRKTHLN